MNKQEELYKLIFNALELTVAADILTLSKCKHLAYQLAAKLENEVDVTPQRQDTAD